jgi:hypothetical protein
MGELMADQVFTAVNLDGFWSGVLASLVAMALAWIGGLLLKNSFKSIQEQREAGKRDSQVLESAMDSPTQYSMFAYGVAQARSLRFFLTAVFIAYMGDIFSPIYPVNLAFYALSLLFIFNALRWLLKIERFGLAILRE